MIYTFLISVVFIAEIIIAITVFQVLIKFDKAVIDLNETVVLAKPGISDISELVRKISEQYKELTEQFAKKVARNSEEMILYRLIKLGIGYLLIKSNIKLVQKIRKSKVTKALAKGLSLLEIMV